MQVPCKDGVRSRLRWKLRLCSHTCITTLQKHLEMKREMMLWMPASFRRRDLASDGGNEGARV